MRKYLPYIAGCLIVGLTILFPETVFSQPGQGEFRNGITNSLASTNPGDFNYVKGITTGRARSLVGGVIGLSSLVIGWRSKVRSSLPGAKIAVILGLLGILLAILHLSTVAGAVFGSGSGKAGSLVALPLAITGFILGGLTLAKTFPEFSGKNRSPR